VKQAQRPQVRPDVALMEGYHSPQVAVDVRLNTNESPVPPPAGFSERLAAEVRLVDWHRYPDRAARELRAGLAAHYGVATEQVFAANGSNEVLLCALLAYGGPGRKAAVFEPTYALHSHIARIAGTAVVEGERGPDFSPISPCDVPSRRRPDNAPVRPTPPASSTRLEAGGCRRAVRGLVIDEPTASLSVAVLIDDDTPLLVTPLPPRRGRWRLRASYCIGPSC
jgi:histidinol-phosphate aminotransferase